MSVVNNTSVRIVIPATSAPIMSVPAETVVTAVLLYALSAVSIVTTAMRISAVTVTPARIVQRKTAGVVNVIAVVLV